MTPRQSDFDTLRQSSDRARRLLKQEALILDVTDLLSEQIEGSKVRKVTLAARLRRSRGFISQLLSGRRNLTLRTLSDLADALGFTVNVTLQPDQEQQACSETTRRVVWDMEDWRRPDVHVSCPVDAQASQTHHEAVAGVA